MRKRFCSNCGNEIEETRTICPSCGRPTSYTSNPEQPPIKNKPNNNFMIVIILAGIIGVGVFTFFLLKEEPEEVTEKFFNYMITFEVEKAERFISKSADPSVRQGFATLSNQINDLPTEVQEAITIESNFHVLHVSKNDDQATVEVEVSFTEENAAEEITFHLQKEKGIWKILSLK